MDSFWRTKAASLPERRLRWPAPLNILTQLVIATLVGGVWGGLFFGFLALTGDEPEPLPASSPVAESAAGPPPASPTAPLTPPPPSPTAALAGESDPTVEPPPTEPASAEEAPALPALLPTATATVAASPTSPPATTEPVPPSPTPVPPPAEAASTVSFAADVYPIIENRCVKCHGGEKTEEGLVMTSHADLLKGSWNGSVLTPGDPENSYMVEQLLSGEMPKNEPRLLPAEVRVISEWIAAGALDN